MEFPPEVQDVIDWYAFEPPKPPPRPIKCHTNYLNMMGNVPLNDDDYGYLPQRCGTLANSESYIEHTFKSSWSSGNSTRQGFCNDCRDLVVEAMLERCDPGKYNEEKEFITTITSDGKLIYNRYSLTEILKRVLHFFKHYHYVPVIPAAELICEFNPTNPFWITMFILFVYAVYRFTKYC